MPELPEIETIRKKLFARILTLKMSSIELRRADLRIPIPIQIKKIFVDVAIQNVRRRSKYLLIDFENLWTLIIHLGMSGRLFFTSPERVLAKHDHVLFNFKGGKQMRFCDSRRFGLVTVCKTQKLPGHELFNHLGVEPLSDDFDENQFYPICQKSVSPIKNLLMNAQRVVGVGNIYANEALFLSGIRPQRRANRVSKNEVKKLCQAVKHVLLKSIESGGTTFRDYVDVDEKPGLHQIQLKVYGRAGALCTVCGFVIQKTVQTNRSSFFCPKCQI